MTEIDALLNRTLIEKAGVDSGFDRAPLWQGGEVLLRSTHHDCAVIVGGVQVGAGFHAWVPRASFTLALLDIPGVELTEPAGSVPNIDYEHPDVALATVDIPALRRLLSTTHHSAIGSQVATHVAENPFEGIAHLFLVFNY